MKEITLRIPEKNYSFFMRLIQQLGYVEVSDNQSDVPESHKKIISNRLQSLKKEDLLDWDMVKDDFILD